jgi:hypothetical protein
MKGPGSSSIGLPPNAQSPLMPNNGGSASIVESPTLHARRSTPGSVAMAKNGNAVISPYKQQLKTNPLGANQTAANSSYQRSSVNNAVSHSIIMEAGSK